MKFRSFKNKYLYFKILKSNQHNNNFIINKYTHEYYVKNGLS